MTLLDIILLIILAIGLILGFKRGFFGTITKPLKLVASICLTILISSPIINAWTRPFFVGKVEGWIYNSLLDSTADMSGEITTESMPFLLKLFANMLKIDLSGVDSAATTEEVLTAMAEQMALPVGNFIAVVVTYILLFIALMLILTLLIALLDVVFTTGWLGKVNKFFGLLLGGVIAAVIACLIANVCYKISPSFASGAITEFFKNINPFAIMMQI